MRKALVVEDDPDIVELLVHYLRAEGFAVDSLGDGKKALDRLRMESYDLLVLDLQLPGIDGLSLCAEVRRDKRTRDVPVVMLTARGDEADRIVGLEMGADDYVVKPFSPKELVARVRALFRRMGRKDDDLKPLAMGGLEVDRERHVVKWEGQPVYLTAKEFSLLVALLEAKGRVLSRQSLLEDVWGYTYAEGMRTVDVHVRRLREKLPGLAPEHRHREVAGLQARRGGRGLMLSLRWRMAAVALAASASALLSLLLFVGPGLRREATASVHDVLLAEARLMARVVEEPLSRGVSTDELDPLVDAAARDVRARVTVVAPDGRVLADSSLSGLALAQVENHGSRPEVLEALASGVGSATRKSATVKDDLLYVAVPVRHAGRPSASSEWPCP